VREGSEKSSEVGNAGRTATGGVPKKEEAPGQFCLRARGSESRQERIWWCGIRKLTCRALEGSRVTGRDRNLKEKDSTKKDSSEEGEGVRGARKRGEQGFLCDSEVILAM